jgi:hypothetical protein
VSLSEDIYQALITDPAVTGLVPVNSIYMQRRTNDTGYPSLNISQDGGQAFPVLAGEVAQSGPIYVTEILATDYESALAIENAVKDVLINTTHSTFTAIRSELSAHLYNEEINAHELIGALSIFYNGA